MDRPIHNPPVLRSSATAEGGQSAIRNRTPSFFWQGTLILLPVLVLAVVGLISLHQDEQAAEQAARKTAEENVLSLARAVGDSAGAEIQRFVSLENDWMSQWYLSTQDRHVGIAPYTPDEKLEAAVAAWGKNYSELKLAEFAVPDCVVLADGRMINPWENDATPSPPKWYCELTAEQRRLWEELSSSPGKAQGFLDTHPSPDARLAAQALAESPQEILQGPPLPPAESGISFQDLASYKLLKSGPPLSGPVLDAVCVALFDRPSLVAPALLELAESETNHADSFTRERVRRMSQFWDRQNAARQYLAPLLKLPDFQSWNTNHYWACWSRNQTDRALAIFTPTLVNANGDATGRQMTGGGWIISFVPERVLEAIFARTLSEYHFLVPDYAAAVITIEGETLSIGGGAALPPGGESRLAVVTQKLGDSPGFLQKEASFSVALYLASREKMLASEQRRTRLFGALIGAAVLAALAGLVTARRAFYQQHHLGELKTNFVSSVSHELRAPIASIRLLAEGLERGKIADPGKKQEYYRFLGQESRRLTALIENVLDFSRIDQGRKDYRFEPADMEAIVDQTVKLMRPAAEEKKVALEWLPNGSTGTVFQCDGLAVQQALINLIDNAVKHSPAGAKVEVGLEGNGGGVRLWVEDHGAGIPPEEHKRIFDRFYRRGSELRRETQGIGIGLTIVKHIVEAHGGRVTVRSAVGQGSRFTMELPGRKAEGRTQNAE